MSSTSSFPLIILVLFSLFLQVLDQSSDVFVAFLYYIEGHLWSAIMTLTLTFLPGVFIFVSEMRKMCSGRSNICIALGYLLFSPLWAIVLHLYR